MSVLCNEQAGEAGAVEAGAAGLQGVHRQGRRGSQVKGCCVTNLTITLSEPTYEREFGICTCKSSWVPFSVVYVYSIEIYLHSIYVLYIYTYM